MVKDEKKIKGVAYTISLSKEHAAFVSGQRKGFKLSKFVRVALDSYIQYVRRLKIKNGESGKFGG